MKIVLLDHELYRMGVRLILDAAPGCGIVGEAGTEPDALTVVDAAAPDIVIMDTVLPGLRGAEGIKAIRGRARAARILILTDDGSITSAAEAMTAGAAGYALKGDSIGEIRRAIEQVRAGRIYVAPALTSRLLARLAGRGRSRSAHAVCGLTARVVARARSEVPGARAKASGRGMARPRDRPDGMRALVFASPNRRA